MKKSLSFTVGIIKAFFALAGRPLRLFSPIGIALASGGGTAIFRIYY
jgi:predicted exporter